MKKVSIIFLVLSLFLSSHRLQGQDFKHPHITGPGGVQINMRTGNLYYERSDLYLPGTGINLNLRFFYSKASDPLDVGFGYGWNFSHNMYYYSDSLGVNVVWGNGHKDLYVEDGGAYLSPAGVFDSLQEYQAGQFRLTTKYGYQYYFDDAAHQKLTSIVDMDGNTVTLAYSGNELASITNASGRSVNFQWANGRLSQMTDINSAPARTYSYTYDNGRLTSAADPLGNAENYEYGDGLARIVDKNGSPVTIAYNDIARVAQLVSCTGEVYRFDYLSDKSFYTRKLPSGSQTYVYTFDELGRNVAVTDPFDKTRTVEYDGDNNRVRKTDYKGNTRTYTYDGMGNRLSTTDPLGNTKSWTYTSFNKVASRTNKRDITYQYDYNANQKLSAINYPDGSVARYAYNVNGQISQYINNREDTTTYSYDSFGNKIGYSYPIGSEAFEYTSTGQVNYFTDADNIEYFLQYDQLDRLITITIPNLVSAHLTYDNNGNLASYTDGNDITTSYTYNPNNNLSGVTQDGKTTAYDYDGNNIGSITNPLGNSYQFGYNKKNKIISHRDPLGNNTSYEYDDNGNRTKLSHPDGKTVTYRYDKLNRLIERDYGEDVDYYAYDENGNVINTYNSNINISYQYNDRNQLISKTYNTWNKNITYQYDENGNRTGMIDPDGGVTTYTYNQNNWLTEINNAFNEITLINYDSSGLVTSLENGNGIVFHFSYGLLKKIDTIDVINSSSEVIANLIYSYDDIGYVTSLQNDGNNPTAYIYDSLYQLKQVTNPDGTTNNYSYDAAGNRKILSNDQGTLTYQHSVADQLLSVSGATYNYDENGNLIGKTEAGQFTTYVYDGLNRLIRVVLPNGNFEEYLYDPFGNRIEIRSASQPARRFIYDGSNILMELDESINTVIQYTSAIQVDSWISFRQNNESYFYHKDPLGSIIAISNTNQDIIKTYTYDEFGNIVSETGNLDNKMTYTGREFDKDVGLYYYRSRFYDPSIGRFISKDKFAGYAYRPASQHKYNYVENNPINFVDPFGFGLPPCKAYDDIFKNALWAGAFACAIGAAGAIAGKSGNALQLCRIGGGGAATASFGNSAFNNYNCKPEPEPEPEPDDPDPDDPSPGDPEPDPSPGDPEPDPSPGDPEPDPSPGDPDPDSSPGDDDDGPPVHHFPDPSEPPGDDDDPGGGDPGDGPHPNNPPGPRPPLPDCTISDLYRCIEIWQSIDPNEITGPIGYDNPRWVSVNDNLGYTIDFENDPDFATAPAQIVDIRLPIDPELNIFSLRLSDFGFGAFNFQTPPNSTYYSKRLDVIDSLGVYVDVTAGIDVVKQEAFWVFESIDPATGLPPDDALVGFLPVNDTIQIDTVVQRGEGFVSFTIKPQSSAVTGDSITAQASIVFDDNAPIITNTWSNLVDAVPPVSTLSSLSVGSGSPSILVEWTGVDDTTAVGVDHYDLYVSVDGAPFTLYQSNIDTTALQYFGQDGPSYAFFVRATDNVGNREPLKGVGEDTITIGQGLLVSPVAFLQGAYDTNSGLMLDALRTNAVLPLSEPFTALGYTHIGGGGESVEPTVFDVSTADAIVDWVFLELRDKDDASVVLATRSALLQRDGDVVEVDGVSPVSFAEVSADEYYLAVKHRNHLGVMSAQPVALSKTATVVDLTGDVNNVFGGINGIAALGDGNLGLYSGDFNRNGQVQNTDYAAMVLTLGTAGYVSGDLDMNGQVQNTDVQFKLIPNIGKGQQFPQ